MKKIRPELVRIEKRLGAARSSDDKTKVITDEYPEIRPTLDAGLEELNKFMKKIAFEADVQNAKFKSRVKPLTSLVNKVLDRGKGLTRMADLVGGMILVDTPDQAKAIYERLKRKYPDLVMGAEEKTKSGEDALGYHGTYHVDILLKGADVVGELQIMTKKLENYKGAAHDIYDKYRVKGGHAAIRANTPAGEANMSRKLFNIGNKPGRLREFIEAIMSGMLVEWGNFQRGGTNGNRTNQRDDKKFTKQEELEMADQSPIFRKYVSKTGWKFQPTIHAAARAFQRRLDFEFDQWKLLHERCAAKMDTFTRWKNGDNYFLFYSRSLEQGYITQVYPEQKTVRIITVLPRGKNLAPADTTKVLVESVGEIEVEIFEMD